MPELRPTRTDSVLKLRDIEIMPNSAPQTISLIHVGSILLRERRRIVRLASFVAFAVGLTLLVLPRKYTATGSFVPIAADGAASQAAGLAAQFGVMLPGSGAGQSPDFYSELLQSRAILDQVVASEYKVADRSWLFGRASGDTTHATLIELLEVDEPTPRRAIDRAVERLERRLTVSVGRLSGTVTVRVVTDTPELSQQIAARMIELANIFNRSQRQTQASAERGFTEERLRVATDSLRRAESRMENFLRENRSWSTSPQLVFERERIAQTIALHQQVVAALARAFEQARIDEVRNTPVLTPVEHPELPGLPDRRNLVVKVLAAFVVVASLVGGLSIVKSAVSTQGATANELSAEEFAQLCKATLEDLKRPWRLLAREGNHS